LVLLIACNSSVVAVPQPEVEPVVDTVSVSVISRYNTALVTMGSQLSEATPRYRVDISTDSEFAEIARSYTSTSSEVFADDLEPTTTYYVRVAKETPAAEDPTATATFTTAEGNYPLSPPKVTLSVVDPDSIKATWKSSAKKANYELEFGDDPELSDPNVITSEKKSLTLDELKIGTEYFARVRAKDAETGKVISGWSPVASVETPDVIEIDAASYNILCYKCKRGKAPWESRRNALVENILSQSPDVLGIQEGAHTRTKEGVPQFADLVNRLGAPYATTSCGAQNAPVCSNVRSESHIIYNAEKLEVLEHGFVKLTGSKKHLAWAIFKEKATGKKFIFGSAHLTVGNSKKALRKSQAKQVANFIDNKAGKLSVVLVGDFNSNKNASDGNAPYQVMTSHGWVDPLGNTPGSRRPAASALVEKRIHTNYHTYNNFERKARHKSSLNGTNIDYIFVTKMRVLEYETVVNINSASKFIGTIPSDHNMIRTKLWIP
jgi:endonuclease/exonuclease/phosphatase family metal-dependent hydrolase